MDTHSEFKLEEAIALLSRTPAALNALLRGLPARWVKHNEGGDSWNARDILGHLIEGERSDWIARARIILEHGEARVFDPFDRLAQKKEKRERPLDELLEEFARRRGENIKLLEEMRLTDEDLERRGRHPALGVVTLRQLLATWATHDMTHLHQLSRVMAHQYRETVGPWTAYLGVLHCTGHGA